MNAANAYPTRSGQLRERARARLLKIDPEAVAGAEK
jgi:hypothetical protein